MTLGSRHTKGESWNSLMKSVIRLYSQVLKCTAFDFAHLPLYNSVQYIIYQ